MGRVSRATGTTALWKGSRTGNCCRGLGQRWRRNDSRTKVGKDAVPGHLRQRGSLGEQEGVQKGGSQYIISWKIRNSCLLERMISSPNLVTGGRVTTALSSVGPDLQKSTKHHTAQTSTEKTVSCQRVSRFCVGQGTMQGWREECSQ